MYELDKDRLEKLEKIIEESGYGIYSVSTHAEEGKAPEIRFVLRQRPKSDALDAIVEGIRDAHKQVAQQKDSTRYL